MLRLHPWTFARYTVREFERAVAGAHVRHGHRVDLMIQLALLIGQWSKRVTFYDLTGRSGPSPIDPRSREVPLTEDDLEQQARAAELLAAHEERMGHER